MSETDVRGISVALQTSCVKRLGPQLSAVRVNLAGTNTVRTISISRMIELKRIINYANNTEICQDKIVISRICTPLLSSYTSRP